MSLNTEQITALRKSHYDEDVLDRIFPHLLSPEDWMDAVNECKAGWDNRKRKPRLVEVGMAWANHGNLQTSRERLQAHKVHDLISIVMLFNGSHWTPDPLLFHLAYRQLGLPTPAALQVGSVTGDLMIKEFKEKVLNSIRFAKCYEETTIMPDRFIGRRVEDISTPEEFDDWKRAFLESHNPKHPRRHAFAESLHQECLNILEHIEILEAEHGHFSAGHLCMLLGRAFEAGKLHAYLEREKDPGAIDENLMGAIKGAESTPERRAMELAFYKFIKTHARPPRIYELRSYLGAVKVKATGPGEPDDLNFESLVLSQKRFKFIFDRIKKSFKNQVE